MKKNTVKAFTLVEMLIVIVIIGILIAALMPRMQAAQGRARDVSRKTALSQVQSAIVTSQGDNGYWPGQCDNVEGADDTSCAENGTGINSIEKSLKTAGMNSVPVDPLKSTDIWGLGDFDGNDDGNYAYLVTKRNGTSNGGFILMAKTEVEGGSNWVVCPESADGCDGTTSFSTENNNGCIPKGNVADITDIHPCTNFHKITDDEASTLSCGIVEATNTCNYRSDGQLRYIVLY